VGRLEVGVASELHDLVLTETLGEPIADGRPPEVVELTAADGRPRQDQAEIPAEVVDDLQP